jgi:dTDP-4-amino-4,6-dideoxygalactose transaminase
LQKAYEARGHREGDFPICEKVAREIVSLPMFPQLKLDQQRRVVEAVAKLAEGKIALLSR